MLQALTRNQDTSDARLVRGCLAGDHGAWHRLIDKYKNLIYSIPIKRGLSPEAAADIFQSVCVALYSELERLRTEFVQGWASMPVRWSR